MEKTTFNELNDFNRLCGLLIRYHRQLLLNTSKDDCWIQKNFIKDENSINIRKKSICGRKTLIKIERGEVIDNEAVYYFLSRRLGFKYEYIPNLLMKLNKLSNNIYFAISEDDKTQLTEILLELQQMYKKYIDYIGYCDYIKLLKMIINAFLELEIIIGDDIANTVLQMSNFYTEEVSVLALRLAHDCFKQNKQLEIYELYSKIKREDNLYQFILVTYFYYFLDPFIAANIIDDLEIKYQETNNFLYLYKLDLSKASVLKYPKPQLAAIYYQQAMLIFESGKISLGNKKTALFYYEYANYLHYIKDFNTAYKYYYKAVKLSPHTSFSALLLILSMHNKINIIDIDELIMIGNKYVSFENQLLENIYNYFIIKQKQNNDLDYNFLEDYILKDILPLFEVYQQKYFYEIFFNELKSLVEKSFHYKRLYQYQEKI